jgi:V/A-type H+/Na+-transporting ATPase subunit I
MRYDVKKYLFIGLESDREAFFKEAQEAGIVHFIETGPAKVKHVPEEVQMIAAAIKVIRGLPPTEQEETEEFDLADGFSRKILSLKETHDKLLEEERLVRMEIARVETFGDFSLEDIAEIEKACHCKFQFFCAREGYADTIQLPDELIYVGTNHSLDYFFAINKDAKTYEKFSPMHIERPIGTLRRRQSEITKELSQSEKRLKSYAKYNTFLHHALINKLNTFHLHAAVDAVEPVIQGALFAVEGWVPINKVPQLSPLVEKLNIHIEEIAIEPTDSIPTYLENTGVARVGEDLVHIYDTPSITDKDPSLWVLFAFSLFFAFIIGDAGYGLILLAVALYIRYKFSITHSVGKRVMSLFMILCYFVIGWGLLTNNFFGINIGLNNPLRKVSVMNWLVEKKAAYVIEHKDETYQEWVKKYPQLEGVTNPKEFLEKASTVKDGHVSYEMASKFSDNILLELALLIGVIHICCSMLRYINRNWKNVGWLLFIIGCYLYLPHFLHATSIINFVFGFTPAQAAQSGLYLIYGGLAIAVVLSFIEHRFLGIVDSINMIIQLFADSLSYLRLYALGLAGGMMAATTNELAASVNIVFGIVILILGHTVNIVLSIMSGVIHGLRLNFLEWYHYSFEGGGKLFNPLRKLKIE